MSTIEKFNAAQSNISDAIILYTMERYLGSWTLASAAYHCIGDFLKSEKKLSTLEEICPESDFSKLPSRIRNLWNMIKHADRYKEDIHLPNEEDARALISFSILDTIILKEKLVCEHKIFLAWVSACFKPHSKQFEELGKRLFPNINEFAFEKQKQYLINSLKIFSKEFTIAYKFI